MKRNNIPGMQKLKLSKTTFVESIGRDLSQYFNQEKLISIKKHIVTAGLLTSTFLFGSLGCKSQRSKPSYSDKQTISASDTLSAAAMPPVEMPPPALSMPTFLPKFTQAITQTRIPRINYKPYKTYLTPLYNPIRLQNMFRDSLITYAKQLLGTPYRSSGRNLRGFDCSGFTHFVYAKFGISLPASSGTQAQVGEKVSLNEVQKGDLVFFGYKLKRGGYRVNHSGIVISEPGEPLQIIHSASGKGVTVSDVGSSRYWRKMFLFTKSVLNDEVITECL